jgi:hypothetical protein
MVVRACNLKTECISSHAQTNTLSRFGICKLESLLEMVPRNLGQVLWIY